MNIVLTIALLVVAGIGPSAVATVESACPEGTKGLSRNVLDDLSPGGQFKINEITKTHIHFSVTAPKCFDGDDALIKLQLSDKPTTDGKFMLRAIPSKEGSEFDDALKACKKKNSTRQNLRMEIPSAVENHLKDSGEVGKVVWGALASNLSNNDRAFLILENANDDDRCFKEQDLPDSQTMIVSKDDYEKFNSAGGDCADCQQKRNEYLADGIGKIVSLLTLHTLDAYREKIEAYIKALEDDDLDLDDVNRLNEDNFLDDLSAFLLDDGEQLISRYKDLLDSSEDNRALTAEKEAIEDFLKLVARLRPNSDLSKKLHNLRAYDAVKKTALVGFAANAILTPEYHKDSKGDSRSSSEIVSTIKKTHRENFVRPYDRQIEEAEAYFDPDRGISGQASKRAERQRKAYQRRTRQARKAISKANRQRYEACTNTKMMGPISFSMPKFTSRGIRRQQRRCERLNAHYNRVHSRMRTRLLQDEAKLRSFQDRASRLYDAEQRGRMEQMWEEYEDDHFHSPLLDEYHEHGHGDHGGHSHSSSSMLRNNSFDHGYDMMNYPLPFSHQADGPDMFSSRPSSHYPVRPDPYMMNGFHAPPPRSSSPRGRGPAGYFDLPRH